MNNQFEEFAKAFHEHFTRDPNACIEKGVDRHLGELPDPSLNEARARCESARTLLSQLDTLNREEASFDVNLDLDLAQLKLQADLHDHTYTWNGRTRLEQSPRAGDAIGDGIFVMLINDPRSKGERLEDITRRIEKVPDYLEALLGRLNTPVARWVAMDLEKVTALPDLFATIEGWARTCRWPDAARLAKARQQAEQALDGYCKRLCAMPTTTELHVGDAVAQRIVALRGIEKRFADLHRMATTFLTETRALIEELRANLVQKYQLAESTSVQQLHKYLNERYRVALPNDNLEAILERYQAERRRIIDFVHERQLFPIPAEQDMKILRTPAFMAPSIPAGAMMPPPPFRAGMPTSLIYLTLSDELRDEHTEITIPAMMIHEGIPGHHLQLATAAKHPSIIRRHFEANEHAEGWTTMLEDYMLDAGYRSELADEIRFCGKRDLSRIGARVAIDLFFMTGEKSYLDVGVDCDLSPEDPFTAAGNLLREVTGFVDGRVQAELNWYSQERGYPLCYLTGNRLVWELKDDVARASGLQGEDLDRTFHRLYLESGNMPVAYLRRLFAHAGLL